MAQKMKAGRKVRGREFEPMPHHLDWFEKNGVDVRIHMWKEHNSVLRAKEAGRELMKKGLRNAEEAMDKYLNNYLSAERTLNKLVSLLSDPALKKNFLAEYPNISEESYDRHVQKLSRKARRHSQRAWRFEKAYSRRYGKKREKYRKHLTMRSETRRLVRSIARRVIERLEEQKADAGEPAKLAAVYSPGKKRRSPKQLRPPKKERGATKSGKGASVHEKQLESLEKRIAMLKKKREAAAQPKKADFTKRINRLRRQRKELEKRMG
ncbi:hypothetical protein GF412_04025 [Candidatus Micrarchaeota archaeon]|nr:hypothetical protein [Candidatus Micrarchaeota archaeon]MBD3418117.1 hypothetical protein [Candidatus Micrarchaeota archaeon]